MVQTMGDKSQQLIQQTELYVKKDVAGNDASHDWYHIDRVRKLAKTLALKESERDSELVIDFELVELCALLHDVADSKYGGSDDQQQQFLQEHLSQLHVSQERIDLIIKIVSSVSFRKELASKNECEPFGCIELDIVRDADRLDAIGAVGIARCMIFTGAKGGLLHDPTIPPKINMTKEEYEKISKGAKGTAVNHFYEKLFKLKDLMRTPSGLAMAEKRHEFMKLYIDSLKDECEGLI